VHLTPGSDVESLGRLDRDEVDIAVISTADRLPPPGYIALPLYRWDRIILISRSHPLARSRTPISLEDLSPFPLVSYESSKSMESSLRRTFEANNLAVNMAMTARDSDLIKTYVRAGFGVGIVAEMAYGRDYGDLTRIDADQLFPQCTTWLLLRKDRLLRNFTLSLIQRLIPGLHDEDVQRLLRQEISVTFVAPHWRGHDAPGSPGPSEI
jgi:DNA-binding transcriptional LysR family regulator